MSLKSPSKFLSLKFLLDLRKNNYITGSGLEYSACEVDSLISEKLNIIAINAAKSFDEVIKQGCNGAVF